jgi:hypothetical protein
MSKKIHFSITKISLLMLFEEMMVVYAEHNMKPTQYKAVFLKLWSAAGFGRKIVEKNVSDTERMKNTPIHVCDETAFVG